FSVTSIHALSLPFTRTWAPSFASSMHIARPMPRVEPVTNAFLPSNGWSMEERFPCRCLQSTVSVPPGEAKLRDGAGRCGFRCGTSSALQQVRCAHAFAGGRDWKVPVVPFGYARLYAVGHAIRRRGECLTLCGVR